MRKDKTLGLDKKKITAVGISLTILGFSILVLILSLRNLWGFLLYGFPKEKHCVHYLLCLIVVIVILSVKDPNNASLTNNLDGVGSFLFEHKKESYPAIPF